MTHKLTTNDEVVSVPEQHTTPCGDCPWRRNSLNGWLGGYTKEEWITIAHSDSTIDCHTCDKQCAGIAIYRANVGKLPRDPQAIRLPKDKENVFSSPMQFLEHHSKVPSE